MKIISLDIKNFGPIEAALLYLDGRGLVNIEGVNNDDPSADSNGAGKSTIPDALYWCLFGETARGVSGDDVIANFAGKNCQVEVRVIADHKTYVISRWRKCKGKGKASGLALGVEDPSGALTDLSQGTDKLTQVKIEQILGCSKEVFTKAVYSGQEALPDLPKMTDKQIKELVEEAAGIEILTRAYELARSHLRDKERAQADAVRNLQEAERRFNDAELAVTNLGSRNISWFKERDERQRAKSKELADVFNRDRALKSVLTGMDLPALKDRLETLRASVDAVREEQDNLHRYTQAVSKARSSAAGAQSLLTAKLAEVRKQKEHYEAMGSKVGTPCRECGKTYAAEDLGTATTLARTRLEELVAEARTLQAARDSANEAVKAAEEAHELYRSGMTDTSAAIAEMTQINEKIRAHSIKSKELEAIEAEARRIDREIAAIRGETNPYGTMLEDAEVKRNNARDEVHTCRDALGSAENQVAVAKSAVATFGPAGVRAYVLDTVTPYLNERTSHYLGTLSDGRIQAIWTTLATNSKGELVEKFCIEVEKAGGGKSFAALSGGEKRKVRLACALALQDLVASRATKPIELWIGDEIDDALDEAGLERLMGVLEEKAREKGTVLVISHNSLSDYIRETVTVKMEGGRSTVTGALT